MTSNVPVKAISAGELKKLRNTSEVIFTALINQTTPLTNVVELTYDGSTGTYTDIKTGYIVWIGSTAGLHDIGITHIRTAATTTEIKTDQIDFTFHNNDHITIKSIGRQAAKLGLHIQRPATTYTMRLDGTPTSLDRVATLVYKSGSGTYTVPVAGETVLVSATAYGKHDKGICRLRKVLPSATTGTMSINETSNIDFADGDYITVINSLSIWQKDVVIEGDTNEILMDYDVTFNLLIKGGCIPRIGPIVAVVKLVSGTVTFTPPSPALTACYDGTTVASYAYSAPGANSTSNMSSGTGTASWTYNTAGTYRWSCAITDSYGRVTTSYRWVIVDPTSEEFELQGCSGDYGNGGWSFKVKLYGDISDVYDRAMVTLYTDTENYGGIAGAIGKLAGYENIINVGWVDGKTINVNTVEGYVEFEVKDASFWMGEIRSFPFLVKYTANFPTNWVEINALTVDKALAQLLFWNSTITSVMDCFFTGDARLQDEITSPSDSLWQQLTDVAFSTIFAKPIINSLGQMFVEIDTQVLPYTDQAAITVIQSLAKSDYIDGYELQINDIEKTSLLDLSGVYFDGTTGFPFFSKAPGNIGATYGGSSSEENYFFLSQAQCNQIAGSLYALANNPYEIINMEMASQNKFIDIAPRQLVTMSLAAIDNPLALVLTNAPLIPRSIDYDYNPDSGFLKPTITFEFLATNADTPDGVTYIPPAVVEDDINDNYEVGDYGAIDFPATFSEFPPYITVPPTGACGFNFNSKNLPWSIKELNGSDDSRLTAYIYYPCKIRGAAYQPGYASSLTVNGIFHSDAAAHYTVYAGTGKQITGTLTGGKWVFNPISDTSVDGFLIELEKGFGPLPLTAYTVGDLIETGTTQSESTTLAVAGNFYAITGANYWTWDGGPYSGQPFYNFGRHPDNVAHYSGVGYTPSLPGLSLDAPSGSTTRIPINSLYAYDIWYAQPPYINYLFKPAELFASATGHDFHFLLYNVSVDGRRITLNTSLVENVCAP